MLKLTSNENDSVCVSEMKDGDIAVVTSWQISSYIGEIVQRYRDFLLVLGADSGKGWNEYFLNPNISLHNQIRILKKGETLVVE